MRCRPRHLARDASSRRCWNIISRFRPVILCSRCPVTLSSRSVDSELEQRAAVKSFVKLFNLLFVARFGRIDGRVNARKMHKTPYPCRNLVNEPACTPVPNWPPYRLAGAGSCEANPDLPSGAAAASPSVVCRLSLLISAIRGRVKSLCRFFRCCAETSI